MCDQERKKEGVVLKESEIPDTGMASDEGVDGEIDEDMQELKGKENHNMTSHEKGSKNSSRSARKDSSGESPRKHRTNSDRRRHHHHHGSSSSSSNHHKRRRSGGHSGEDSETVEDASRSRKRSDSGGDDHSVVSSSRTSQRQHRDRRSSHSQKSRRHEDRAQAEHAEGHVSSSHSKRGDRERKTEAEAEDGEILEDGELGDDDDENGDGIVSQEDSRLSLDTSHEDAEGSPVKPVHKEEGRNQKKDRKRPDRKDKRKKDEDKKKRKRYVDMDKVQDVESGPAPAWGSGYQGARPKSSSHTAPSHGSPPYGKPNKNNRDKGYQSPPGLYDSPSYSEDSEDDQFSRAMFSEGYVDASVAADEKEGIFKRGLNLKKKKRLERNMAGFGKRRGQDFGKGDGPPKKKALTDMAMSDRPKCRFFKDGKCAKGSGCPFNHDMVQAKRLEVCRFHLNSKGCHKENCRYMHEDFPCKYHHTGAQCFSGDRCKFSHDPLTEESRKALEMRVAPEDIIYVDDPDYDPDYDYRQRNYESRNRPSLLGSPPRRHEVKKIPSLFDIEVHPPAPSPKPSPSSVRPTGFYNEAGSSPPSSGSSTGNSQGPPPPTNNSNNNTSNNGNSNNGNISNQVVVNNNNNQAGGGPGLMRPGNPNISGPGLLQTPNLPPVTGGGPLGPMMGGPMAANRPPLMGNPSLRPGIPFINNGNNNAPSNNFPPVLNVLGAILREAAMQNVNNPNPVNMNMNNMAGGMNMVPNSMNNMPPNSMANTGQNSMNNMGPNPMNNMNGANSMNNMGNMMQGNMNAIGPNNMNNMGPNNMNRMMQGMNQMGPNNMNPMGPTGMNMMAPNNMNQLASSNNMSSNIPNNAVNDGKAMDSNMVPPTAGHGEAREQEDMMDVDYRIKQNFEDKDDVSQDLSELNSIRRRLQEQIEQQDAEEEEEVEEDESKMDDPDVSEEVQQHSDGQTDDKSGLSPEQTETATADDGKKSKPQDNSGLDNIEIPSHLPKKQRELFMRIQQQQILRERERERQEALRAEEEAETKAEKDDWYSDSDEDEEEKPKTPKLQDKQKAPQESTSTGNGSSNPPPAAVPSTFNIMQMINAIRSQGAASSVEAKLPSSSSSDLDLAGPSNSSGHGPTVQSKSPMSSPSSPSIQSSIPSFHLPPQAVEPPVVSATSTKPMKYAVVRINLNMSKTYTELPNGVDISDPTYRFDPRVKRHLQLLDKQPPVIKEKEIRRASVDSSEKAAKLVDPRLKRAPTDPRLAKMGGGSPGSGRPDEGRPVDPRLKKDTMAARPVDPRLAKRAASVSNDPRLNRQLSQDPNNQIMGGALGGNNNPMGNINNMGGPMSNMGGPMNNMGGPMNNLGGPMNNMGGPPNNMAGPMHNLGGLGNNQMSGFMTGPVRPMQGVGPMNRMSGPMNPLGNPVNSMGIPLNNMGGNRMSNPMMANSQANMMGGPMNRISGARDVSNSQPLGVNQGNFLENTNDPRLNQRLSVDPRTNDPRFQNKSHEAQDQGMNRNDPRLMSSNLRSKDSGNDPRLSNDPRRASALNRGGVSDSSVSGISGRSPNLNDVFEEKDSSSSFRPSQGIIEPLPSLSSSASLPPLPSLSPPSLPTLQADTQPSSKESSSEVQKSAKKFDYRNDPRFKRVKRTAAARQSMEYSSPLGDDGEALNSQEQGGSLQYNSYNRPKPTGSNSPHRQNAPSPSLPDTLQDFDLPELPPLTVSEATSEPDLKVKDLFKTIDPTASPFC